MLRMTLWFLLVLSLALLGVFAVVQSITRQGTSNPTVAQMTQARFCNDGETILEEEGPQSAINRAWVVPTTVVYCVSEGGSRREVTTSYVTFLMTLSGVPFVMGLVLLLLSVMGIALQSRQARQKNYQAQAMTSGRYQANSDLKSQDSQMLVNQLMTNMGNQVETTVVIGDDADPADLPRKLEQLEKARKAGILTEAQYEQARRALEDRFRD